MDTEVYVYDDKIRPIDKVEFSILGNEEIKRISALRDDPNGIDIPELYDNADPKRGGLIDPRLGAVNNEIDCATCGLNSTKCNGHFGHIALAEPVFHYGYFQIVKRILSCTCLRCSKLLTHKNEDLIIDMLKNKTGRNRLNEVRNLTKNVSNCQNCGTPVSKIKIEINKNYIQILLVAEIALSPGVSDNLTEDDGFDPNKKRLRQILTPDKVYEILSNISDEDCRIMGIEPTRTRPEDMVQHIFPVPPVQVRPSVKADFMSTNAIEDHLTVKLADIIKANSRIRKYKEAITDSEVALKYGADQAQLLQYHTATYFDNETLALPKSEQRAKPTKSLSSRLKGKEGRVRNNLMGKRVDFSARTVITPDPSLDVNELGVPIKIAKNLTFPEIVTPQNIKKLQKLVKNGRKKYPGANFVFPLSNSSSNRRVLPIDLRYREGGVDLKYGDIVERHLVNGDYVLLNRQPTLHKLSMMGHKVKIIENDNYATLRLNVSVTGPYNADFDGDEMNIFVPQSLQSAFELEKIGSVSKQIITPRVSLPIIGLVQDGLVGSYLMTRNDKKICWQDAMNILSYTTFDDFEKMEKRDYLGTELVSKIIPNKISTKKGNFELIRGQINNDKGILNKKMLGAKKPNSLIHLIWDEYGQIETQNFIDNIQRMVNNFNIFNGFSVGLGDIDMAEDLNKIMNHLFETKKLEVKHKITEIENNPSVMDTNLFEQTVFAELNTIRDEVSKLIVDNMDVDNNFKVMSVGSESKGGPINLGQMAGCVGQQAVEGQRIRKKINGRTLPYFHQNDDSAEARGFIQSSYVSGLTPIEFIQHNMSSREGLIDTAIKTAESGYVQRKLIKTMEDISVKYDGTVRNSNDTILQFIYGDCGIDCIKQYNHELISLLVNNNEFDKLYKFSDTELKKYKLSKDENDKYVKQIKTLRDIIRQSQRKANINFKLFNAKYMLPVNFHRIIENTKFTNDKSSDKLEPKYILKCLEDMCEYEQTKIISISKKEMKNKNNQKLKDENISKTIFRYSLHNFLSPKRVLEEYKFNKKQFDSIMSQIKTSFNKNIVEPGEMVGVISAQSIGEPVTQMTLNTFHSAGIGSKGTAALGVPRVRELLSVSKNMKTPMMELYFNDDFKKSKNMANKIGSFIKYTNIGDIRQKIDIFYEPNPYKKDGHMEQDKVFNIFHSHNPRKHSCQSEITNLPWLMRIELDKEKMIDKDITLLDIKSKFCSFWEKRHLLVKGLKKDEKKILEQIQQIAILSNSDNSSKPILHIRFDMFNFNYSTIIKFVDILIENFQLKGIENIKDIYDIKSERVVSFDDKTGEIKKDEEYVVYSSGVNLTDIRYLNGIDQNRTICNDIISIYEEFGIESARLALLREIKGVIEGAGNNVNYQHLSLLADVMTSNGNLVSVDRHGINKVDTNPFARSTFEKTIEQFINAAVFCETDSMRSVSSRIMSGLVIKGGTGAINLKLDTDLLENSEFVETSFTYDKKLLTEVSQDPVIKDTIDNDNINEEIFMPM